MINIFSKTFLVFWGLFYLNTSILAQENQGLIFDNYNPVNGQFINPSIIVDAKPWLDINLVGASVFVFNNYLFYPNTTLLSFGSFTSEPSLKEDVSTIKAYESAFVTGPSASLVIGRQSFSVYSNVRTISNGINIPSVLAKKSTQEGLDSSDIGIYNIKNARAKVMAWGEIGITYGGIIRTRETNMITAAVSVKRLFGLQNSSVNFKEAELIVVNPDSVVVVSNTGTYSYTEPSFNAGRGWGINAGATFKKMKGNVTHYIPHSTFSDCRIIDYKYKIGISLLDIGYINFKNEAFYGDLEDITLIDTIDANDDILEEAKRLASGNRYTAPLPMAASVQVDYNINDNFFLNGTIIQRLPSKNSYGAERANLLAITPRYESKYIGVSIPVSYVNYEEAYVGLAFRLAFLSIGTENILPWFVKQDINMVSFYFYLKITLFKSPPCRDKKYKDKSEEYILNACPEWN